MWRFDVARVGAWSHVVARDLGMAMMVVVIGTATPAAGNSSLRLVKVDPISNQITLRNVGTSPASTVGFFLEHRFNAQPLGSGSLNPGQERVYSVSSLHDTSSDIGLFSCGSFNSPSCMEDFFQYGGAGIGRESVAVADGIWTLSAFLLTPGPFMFVGTGSETGPREGLWVRLPEVLGDYNRDSIVDAADFVAWRKSDSPQESYETWRANFGRAFGGGAYVNQPAVPEPESLNLFLMESLGSLFTFWPCSRRGNRCGGSPCLRRSPCGREPRDGA
jgi:hypothetical protein